MSLINLSTNAKTNLDNPLHPLVYYKSYASLRIWNFSTGNFTFCYHVLSTFSLILDFFPTNYKNEYNFQLQYSCPHSFQRFLFSPTRLNRASNLKSLNSSNFEAPFRSCYFIFKFSIRDLTQFARQIVSLNNNRTEWNFILFVAQFCER